MTELDFSMCPQGRRSTRVMSKGRASLVINLDRKPKRVPCLVLDSSKDHPTALRAGQVFIEDKFNHLAAPKVETSAQPETLCHVVGIESNKSGCKFSVDVEFTHSAAKFWGVLFPPENLDPAERKLPRSHRQHLRVECSEPVRIRPADDSTDDTEDVCCTQNISRDGLYFTGGHLGYREGMCLLIRFLQCSDSSASDTNHKGQVVRLDHGKDGRMGVAVKLLEPITWQTARDGLRRVVVVRSRKVGRKSSKTAPASVAELAVPEMKDEPKTTQEREKPNKTKTRVDFRLSLLMPELWRQLKGAIFLPHIRRILYCRGRKLLRIEKTSALSEE